MKAMKKDQIDDLSNDLFTIEFYRQLLITMNDIDFVGIEEVRKEIEKLYLKHITKSLKKQDKILRKIAKSILND